MSATKSTVLVGRVGGAYGIKGWLRINSFTDPAENILGYTPWHLHAALDGKLRTTVNPAEGKRHGKGLVARFDKVLDRDEAEQLAGLEIRVDRDCMPAPAPGEFYWADLQGLRVVSRAGDELGQVDHLLDTGSADVMVVIGSSRLLIPFIFGETVLNVDLDAGCIQVDWETES